MLAVLVSDLGEALLPDINMDFGIEEIWGLGAWSCAWLWGLLKWPSLSFYDIALKSGKCWGKS
jgi:hypothetical protein